MEEENALDIDTRPIRQQDEVQQPMQDQRTLRVFNHVRHDLSNVGRGDVVSDIHVLDNVGSIETPRSSTGNNARRRTRSS